MFDEFWALIGLAPYYIFGSFLGGFLLTFIAIKLSQSDTIYDWFTVKTDLWRAKQSHKIRLEMATDLTAFLRGRKEEELPPREQKIYYRMLESYYSKIEQLYATNEGGESNESDTE
jgi:hypothetical protein